MKKWILILLLSLNAFALNLSEINTVMQTKMDKSLEILKETKGDKKNAADSIFKLFDGIFDFKLMAKLSLSKYYDKLSASQKEEFNQKFEASLKKSFSDKLSLYKDEILKVKSAEQKNENRYFLTSSMIIDGEEKLVVFKFYNDKNNWLIYDIDVLGVSIIQTYRSQFGDILENADFNALLTKLEQVSFE